MHYDRERVVQRMRKWETYLNEHALPSWDELPALDLYMDQVVALLNSYLGFLPKGTDTAFDLFALQDNPEDGDPKKDIRTICWGGPFTSEAESDVTLYHKEWE